jgi:hypothetical protein
VVRVDVRLQHVRELDFYLANESQVAVELFPYGIDQRRSTCVLVDEEVRERGRFAVVELSDLHESL